MSAKTSGMAPEKIVMENIASPGHTVCGRSRLAYAPMNFPGRRSFTDATPSA